MGSNLIDPLGPERPLVLIEAVHRFARLRFVVGPGDIHSAEIHLGAALTYGQLDRPPSKQVKDPRVVAAGGSMIGRVRGRESPAVPVQEQARQW